MIATNVKFLPNAVPLMDMTFENVGQLLPQTTFLKNFQILYEVGKEGNKIAPKNGTNAAALVCRKKIQINCSRLLRVTTPAAAPQQ